MLATKHCSCFVSHVKGQRGVGGRVACVMVPPCKGLRSLAAIARSRLLRWALARLPLPLPTGAPYGLVLKVGAVKIPGCLFQLLLALGCRWYCLLKHCTVCA